MKWKQPFEADGSDKTYMIYKFQDNNWTIVPGIQGSTVHSINKVISERKLTIVLTKHGSAIGNNQYLVVEWNSNIALDQSALSSRSRSAKKNGL